MRERKRRDRLMQFATMRGWTYVAEDPRLVDRWPGEPFGQGDNARARNVLGGTESGRPFTAFDYSYETHSTDSKGNRTTIDAPLDGVRRADAGLPGSRPGRPRVGAGPAGRGGRAGAATSTWRARTSTGGSGSAPTSPKLASDILTPRTMQYLIGVDAGAWRTCGSDLVGFRQGALDPADVVRTCSVLGQVQHGIPSFVWKDAGGPASWIQSRTMTALWIVLGLVVLLAVFVAVSYNRFVSQRNLVQESWRQIDVELKRRHDLIPNLVETVKGYATHEREVFDAVTRARAAAASPGCVTGRSRRSRRACSGRRWAGCSRSPRPTRTSRRAPTSSSCSVS